MHNVMAIIENDLYKMESANSSKSIQHIYNVNLYSLIQ